MSFNTYPQNPFPPNSENAGGGSTYVLPIASAETLGGVKVGNNLSIDDNGVLSASNIFSTTPVKVGKWIDNKDIYRVVFTTGAVSAGSGVDIEHGLNIDTLVSVKGIAVLNDRKLPLPYCDDTATYQRSIIVSDTKVTISGYSNSHALIGAHVIVEYTEVTV